VVAMTLTPADPSRDSTLVRFSAAHLASVFASLMVVGLAASFSLLWSMSHGLTRINDRLDVLAKQLQSLSENQSSVQRELALLDRRLSLVEQKVGAYGR